MSDAATLEAPQDEAATTEQPKKRKRGRGKDLDDFMEGKQTLTVAPSVPDEYNPYTFKILKEANFEDVATYHEHMINVFEYKAAHHREEKKAIEATPPEARAAMAAFRAAQEAMKRQAEKLLAAGVDLDSLE